VLVGLGSADDAGVVRLRPDLALIQTVDFFTPIVDDPFDFGRAAAANALSDVYAMGGTPLCAMNIVAFPAQTLPLEVLRQVLQGGLALLAEAGAYLVGGHTVQDQEFKYGLAVSGLVHPDALWTKGGAQAGDTIILTKPLGTGIVATALKAGMASERAAAAALKSMVTLNKRAAEIARDFTVHAATDVTGFGLAGHALEMLRQETLGFVLTAHALPRLPEVEAYADLGLLPAGLHRNRSHFGDRVFLEPGLPPVMDDLLHDPQSSGGLLLVVPAAQATACLAALHAGGVAQATIIGQVIDGLGGGIAVV